MDMQASGPIDAGAVVDGPYQRRAQALLATRAELFVTAQARSVRLAGIPCRSRANVGAGEPG